MLFNVKIFTGVTRIPEEKLSMYFFQYGDFSLCFLVKSNANKAWQTFVDTRQLLGLTNIIGLLVGAIGSYHELYTIKVTL